MRWDVFLWSTLVVFFVSGFLIESTPATYIQDLAIRLGLSLGVGRGIASAFEPKPKRETLSSLKHQMSDLEKNISFQNPLKQFFTERKINELRKRIEELKEKKKSHQN